MCVFLSGSYLPSKIVIYSGIEYLKWYLNSRGTIFRAGASALILIPRKVH